MKRLLSGLGVAFAAFLTVSAGGCRSATPPLEPGRVCVLQSSDRHAYQVPVRPFSEEIGAPVNVVSLGRKGRRRHRRAIMEAVRASRPPLIFALGVDAVRLARRFVPEAPVVFGVVINWKHFRLKELPQTTGIALEIPPEAQLTQLKLVAPDVRRVGVIYSRASTEVVARAREIAKHVDVKLVEAEVKGAGEVKGAWRRIRRKVDALWMVPDGQALDTESFAYLRSATVDAGVCFVGFSDKFVQAGCLMSLAADYEGIGSQAGLLARRILDGEVDPATHDVEEPVSTVMTLNVATAREIGLDLSDNALDLADELVGGDPDDDADEAEETE